jgi:nitrogenase iron protein NifH
MREGYAEEVYLVTSGELMSLYAANNIAKAIARLAERPRCRCRLAGVILNAKGMEREEELVRAFADAIGARLIAAIPRDRTVQIAELHRRTVVEDAPDSAQAAVYRRLADDVLANTDLAIPRPLTQDDLESLAIEYTAF